MGVSRMWCLDEYRVFVFVLLLSTSFLICNFLISEKYQLYKEVTHQEEITFKATAKEDTGLSPSSDNTSHFDINGSDVFVLLHIQKTSGSRFGRHLVQDLDLPCECIQRKDSIRCSCYRPNGGIWLVSKYSTGWACGVHADWMTLRQCVPKAMNRKEKQKRNRRYLYITLLREPTARYISEWLHVQRGGIWPVSNTCNGHSITSADLPSCYSNDKWNGVNLEEFLDCKWNLAINRQTRMLANLSLVDCFNISGTSNAERNQLMLASAKENLRQLAFFGLTEFQVESQFLFERTFNVGFRVRFEQDHRTRASKMAVTPSQLERIKQLNSLDVELYDYAKTLFMQRLESMQDKYAKNSTFSK